MGTEQIEVNPAGNPFQNTSSAAQKFTQLVRGASLLRLKQLLNNPDIQTQESPPQKTALPPGHWMAMNIIAGSEFRIILKLFFDTVSIQEVGTEVLTNDSYQGRADTLVRKYCNSLVQLITASLERQDLTPTHCAPVILHGFDHFFCPPPSYPKLVDTNWALKRGTHLIHFQLSLEIIDTTVLKKLRRLPDDLENFSQVVDFVMNNTQV